MRRLLILAVLAGLSAGAQEEYRLRVTVDLVQVDAMVTDAQGNPVPDLKAGDFRLFLDGKPQELKYCNYVRVNDAAAAASPGEVDTAAVAARPAMPSQPVRREDVRRTIVLFVGDLLTSSESIPAIRAGLKKFVEEQMQPGDLAAIVRSGAGLGALQDFTTDRRMLMAAIDQVRWSTSALGIGGASAYEAVGQPGLQGNGALDLAQLDKIDSIERATLATTYSLLKVVRAMAPLPGRKSLIILSDGLRLTSPDEMDPFGNTATGSGAFLAPIYKSMRNVVDESVRAGVVLYAVDTRGQSSLLANASDRLKDPGAGAGSRRDEYRDNQWGGMFISSQTGGFMVTEANHIDAALARVMADQRGYYLLGFQPPAEAMHPDNNGALDFHRLKIEMVKPGLSVRSHAGFFGVAGEAPGASTGPELQLSQPLDSATGIGLDVEAGYVAGKREFIRTTVYIDGNDVLFQGPPIHRTGVLHLMVRAFNANGGMLSGGIDQIRRIDLDEAGYERAQKYGLIYTALLPAPKPGSYRVRVACRDEATGKSGAGADFVSIPEMRGKGPRLSGIVFQHDLGTDNHILPATMPRVYAGGASVSFAVQITGAPADGLQMRTRLYRNGAQVWESAPLPVAGSAARGSFEVPRGLDPGRYMVRVEIAEKAADNAVAWQWAKLTLR
ncbi:MAG: VWA domain-containing protein [Candidatus Sulfopaludibacter sp.]|nr:VWA domain-containing protein [Candidatus Sulfopaludibacter sp.]